MDAAIYAKPSDNAQQFGGTCPDGWVQMQSERPEALIHKGENMLIFRFILWFAMLPAHLIIGALAMFLAPILPLFAIHRNTLPKWLSWFQTPDATLDGDSGFAKIFPIDKYPEYYRRVRWLWRNPAYGFAWTILAYTPKTLEYFWKGSLTPDTRKGLGWFLIWQPDGHFQFSVRAPSLPAFHFWRWQFRARVFYFRFGWKIIGLATDTGNKGPQKYVFTLNPVDPV